MKKYKERPICRKWVEQQNRSLQELADEPVKDDNHTQARKMLQEAKAAPYARIWAKAKVVNTRDIRVGTLVIKRHNECDYELTQSQEMKCLYPVKGTVTREGGDIRVPVVPSFKAYLRTLERTPFIHKMLKDPNLPQTGQDIRIYFCRVRRYFSSSEIVNEAYELWERYIEAAIDGLIEPKG